MATPRRSSRSQATASTAVAETLGSPSEKTAATPEPSDKSSPSASNGTDNTHQAAETAHVKKDQQLEATDPDILSAPLNPAAAEQLNEAATTPINTEIQEEEPMSSQQQQLSEEASVDAHNHQNSHQDVVERHVVSEEGKEPVHSVRLVGHIKGVPGHSHGQPTEQDNRKELSALDEPAQSNGATVGMQSMNNEGQVKHAKRAVDEDTNTVAEEELQDYNAGAYKSPFRHTHKAERAGKEER
ncbi:hypothetical protein EDD11_005294 [Mortierella claussenii]|nr:hypothetical protein EDD11_005294 [Mortierella claussenii]